MRHGRYYLGRVIKSGVMNQVMLRHAILEAVTVPVGEAFWTITDVVDFSEHKEPFIFGRLSKFAEQGQLTVVDPVAHSQRAETAENLLLAAAPFVYLPDLSGIAYLHVWNGVQEDVFRRRFRRIVEEYNGRFFVRCEIDPISDYRAFSAKLKGIKRIYEIRAKVFPPNPMFGDLWKELNEYIEDRNAAEVVIAERSDSTQGLSTDIVELVNLVIDNRLSERHSRPAAIADAAILMAADGYGHGKVTGQGEDGEVVVRTSDSQKSFLHAKDPEIAELAAIARQHFESISDERDMQH